MATEDTKQTPPYVSFKTLFGFVDGIVKGVLPQRIDNSTMGKLSGRNKVEVRSAMRFLSLITPDGTPTDYLHELVDATDAQRAEIWQRILKRAYPTFIGDDTDGFNIANATHAQFREKFRMTRLSQESIIKAERFFLSAAEIAGIPVSPHIKNYKRSSGRESATGLRPSTSRPKAPSSQVNVSRLPANSNEINIEQDLSPRERKLHEIVNLPEFNPEWDIDVQRLWYEQQRYIATLLAGQTSEEEESGEG